MRAPRPAHPVDERGERRAAMKKAAVFVLTEELREGVVRTSAREVARIFHIREMEYSNWMKMVRRWRASSGFMASLRPKAEALDAAANAAEAAGSKKKLLPVKQRRRLAYKEIAAEVLDQLKNLKDATAAAKKKHRLGTFDMRTAKGAVKRTKELRARAGACSASRVAWGGVGGTSWAAINGWWLGIVFSF